MIVMIWANLMIIKIRVPSALFRGLAGRPMSGQPQGNPKKTPSWKGGIRERGSRIRKVIRVKKTALPAIGHFLLS
jgi:hypothetical protein